MRFFYNHSKQKQNIGKTLRTKLKGARFDFNFGSTPHTKCGAN